MRANPYVGRVLAVIGLFTGLSLFACGEPAASDRLPPAELPRVPITVPRVQTEPLPDAPALGVDPDLARVPRPRAVEQLTSATGSPLVTGSTTLSVDAKLLVVSANGNEVVLPGIRRILDFLGTPYTVMIASQDADGLTAADLRNGNHGYYSGIILVNGALMYRNSSGSWVSAFDRTEWTELFLYEETFGARQVTWYTRPTADYGFLAINKEGCNGAGDPNCKLAPINGTLTTAGLNLFPHLNSAHPVQVKLAWTYFAQPDLATATPLLVDPAGNALITLRKYANGRENLAMTFDGNENLIHTLQLGYDVVSWVSRGLFIGEHHAYLATQVDDLFIDDDCYWGGVYRITGADLQAVHNWQQALQLDPLTPDFRVDFAFNGEGTTGIYLNDTLVPKVQQLVDQFKWINHTWSHRNLNGITVRAATRELNRNNTLAASMGLTPYTVENLVTPDVSGLNNKNAMTAAFNTGVRYVVSDTSATGGNNPSPNAGKYNRYAPGILQIPRHPTNLFYNVGRPDEWVDEYNDLYRSYWGRDLTFDEILAEDSALIIRYLLNGDLDPLMFHQTNVRAYDSAKTRTLLADLVDTTVLQYGELLNFPILSPTMDELGTRMARRMALNASGAKATIGPGNFVTLTATRAATVPVTGLNTAGAEQYAGTTISWVPLAAGQSVTYPLQ